MDIRVSDEQIQIIVEKTIEQSIRQWVGVWIKENSSNLNSAISNAIYTTTWGYVSDKYPKERLDKILEELNIKSIIEETLVKNIADSIADHFIKEDTY